MKKIGRSLVMVILAAVSLACIFPLLLVVTNSFMGADEIARYYSGLFSDLQSVRLHLVPDFFTFSQYYEALFCSVEFYDLFQNGAALSLPILAGTVIISTLTGYGFAKYRFPLRRVWLYIYMVAMLLPYQITLIPNFILINRMGLLGSRWAIILIGIFSPFGTYLMYCFASGLPDELMEAASLDGASAWKIFWRVMLPSLKGGIASLVILNLVDTWNMVEQPMVLLQDSSKYPITLLLSEISRTETEKIFVDSLVSLSPILILFVGLRSYLILGIETSVIKE